MAARSRPRGQLKEEFDEERVIWNSIKSDGRRVDQLMVRVFSHPLHPQRYHPTFVQTSLPFSIHIMSSIPQNLQDSEGRVEAAPRRGRRREPPQHQATWDSIKDLAKRVDRSMVYALHAFPHLVQLHDGPCNYLLTFYRKSLKQYRRRSSPLPSSRLLACVRLHPTGYQILVSKS